MATGVQVDAPRVLSPLLLLAKFSRRIMSPSLQASGRRRRRRVTFIASGALLLILRPQSSSQCISRGRERGGDLSPLPAPHAATSVDRHHTI